MKRLLLTAAQEHLLTEMAKDDAAAMIALKFEGPADDADNIRTHVHHRARYFLLQEILADEFPDPEPLESTPNV